MGGKMKKSHYLCHLWEMEDAEEAGKAFREENRTHPEKYVGDEEGTYAKAEGCIPSRR